jgi:hypothetical protein
VFEIQDEIAGAVATAMASGDEPTVAGAGSEVAELVPSSVRTSDLGAYELYLAGRHHWATRTPDGLEEAVRLFEAALDRDSTYSPAWVGLSAVYNALPWYTDYPPREGGQRSKEAGQTALRLDPDNAEALYTLATTAYEYDRDWIEAARLFRRAISLDPEYSQGLAWYCYFLADVGRVEESIAWCEKAVELDPLRVNTLVSVGEVLTVIGRSEEGLRAFSRALALQPNSGYAQSQLTIALMLRGRLDEAEVHLRRYASILGLPGGEASASTIIEGMRDPSRREEAVAAVMRWMDHPEIQSSVTVDWLVLLGAREEALDVVEEMLKSQSPDFSSLHALPVTSMLRGNPRFEAAITALNIPDPPPAAEAKPW